MSQYKCFKGAKLEARRPGTSHVALAFISPNTAPTLPYSSLPHLYLPHPLFWDTSYMCVKPFTWSCQSLSIQATITEYHGLGGLKRTAIYFSPFWRLWSPRCGVWWGPASWLIDSSLLAVFSNGRRGKRALCGYFYNGTDPIHEGSTLLVPSHQGLGFSIWIWVRGTNLQSLVKSLMLFYFLSFIFVYPKSFTLSYLPSYLLILSSTMFNLL